MIMPGIVWMFEIGDDIYENKTKAVKSKTKKERKSVKTDIEKAKKEDPVGLGKAAINMALDVLGDHFTDDEVSALLRTILLFIENRDCILAAVNESSEDEENE